MTPAGLRSVFHLRINLSFSFQTDDGGRGDGEGVSGRDRISRERPIDSTRPGTMYRREAYGAANKSVRRHSAISPTKSRCGAGDCSVIARGVRTVTRPEVCFALVSMTLAGAIA